MPRKHLAVVLAAALVALWPTPSVAETETRQDPVPQWRHAGNMHVLMAALDDWLDMHGHWARRDAPPHVRIVSERAAAARRGTTSNFHRGRLRGLYDPDQAEILLVEPWDPRNAQDVSTLLHELVHHRQAAQDWYCPAAQELTAYRLQDVWLNEQGLRANVNWVAVALESNCTLRNVHPD